MRITISIVLLSLFIALTSCNNNDNRNNNKCETALLVDSLINDIYKLLIDYSLADSKTQIDKALNLSNEINYREGKAKANICMSYYYLKRNKYLECLDYLQIVKKEKSSLKEPLFECEYHRIFGQLLSIVGLHQEGLDHLTKSKYFANKIQDTQARKYLSILANENEAYIYRKIGNQLKAFNLINVNKELLSGLDESIYYPRMINMHTSLSRQYRVLQDIPKAFEEIEQAVSLLNKYNFPDCSATYFQKGDLFLLTNSYDSAFYYLNKALLTANELDQTNEINIIHGKLFKVYKDIGDSLLSEEHLALSLKAKHKRDTKKNQTFRLINKVLLEEKKVTEVLGVPIMYIILSLSVLFSILVILYITTFSKNISNKRAVDSLSSRIELYSAELIDLLKSDYPAYFPRFSALYPNVITNLQDKHPLLNVADLEFCSLIFLNLSSKKISTYTHIQHRSVQTKKGRLRKKLELDDGVDLYRYLSTFDK